MSSLFPKLQKLFHIEPQNSSDMLKHTHGIRLDFSTCIALVKKLVLVILTKFSPQPAALAMSK